MGGQGAGDAGVHVLGVQAVQGEQARHEFVVVDRLERPVPDLLDDPGEPGAVEVHEDAHQFLRRRARCPVAGGGEPVEHLLDPAPGLGAVDRGPHPPSPLRPVGTCIVLTVLPPPTYMWTPQGRQGSKLRTARMMSMPLKFSGVFSSKIGVFCTASS